jgi:hypothetical protein
MEISMKVSQKTKQNKKPELPYAPAMPLPGSIPEEIKVGIQ